MGMFPVKRLGGDQRVGLALLAVWGILAFTIAARRPAPADIRHLPDPPTAPLTIDLNRDPWPRLLLIEGIGEALAQRIVRAREESGGFDNLAEVKAIPGIPDNAIERARPWLTLGDRSTIVDRASRPLAPLETTDGN